MAREGNSMLTKEFEWKESKSQLLDSMKLLYINCKEDQLLNDECQVRKTSVFILTNQKSLKKSTIFK